jgi:hypothetical protein
MREIELPDGSIGEFPDEMDDESIAGVLRQQFGGPQPQPGAPTVPQAPPQPISAPVPPSAPASVAPGRHPLAQFGDTALDFLSGAGKGLGQLAAGAGETIRHAGRAAGVLSEDPGAEGQPLSQRIRGQRAAFGLEPEGGAQTAGAFVGKAAPAFATGGAGLLPAMATSAGLSAGQATIEGATPGEAAVSGAVGAAGPLAAKAVKWGGGKLADAAIDQYRKALNPTTRATKIEASQIIPELLKRRISGSLEQLAEQGKATASQVGGKIARAYESSKKAVDPVRLADELEQLKTPFVGAAAEGLEQGKTVLNETAVKAIGDIQDLLRTIKPDAANLWKLRKNIDNIVQSTNGFTRPLTPGAAAAVARDARAVIQKELSKAVPNVEKLNDEYRLWKSLSHVAGETALRKTGQQGLQGWMARGVGGAIGTVVGGLTGGMGGGVAGAMIGQQATKAVSDLVASPAWRTVSAVQKNRIANLLMSDKTEELLNLVGRLTGVAATRSDGPRDYKADVEAARRRREIASQVR